MRTPHRRSFQTLTRERAAARAANNRPDLSRYLPVDPDPPRPPAAPVLEDWPRIESRHPTWWQVQRVEKRGDQTVWVLIAEVRSEDAAFRIAHRQKYQVRISKYGDRQKPYYSHREPKVVTNGPSPGTAGDIGNPGPTDNRPGGEGPVTK